MATASISGLSSGLDTASIISQLMQVEAIGQSRIKSRMTAEQSTVKSLQELNGKLAALATQAEKLAKPAGWSPLTITSSHEKVSATAASSGTAATGVVSFTVNALAAAHKLTYATTSTLSAPVTSGSNTVRLDYLDGTTRDVDTGDGTLQGLVNALNGAGTGVRASTVRLDDGSYRLSVTSADTGAASDFTLKNLDGSDLLGGATVTAGTDASITVGSDTVTSASNTFSGTISGLDITLGSGVAPGTTVDLTVARDTAGLTKQVKELVDAVNTALSDIDKLTAYNATTKSGGALSGDSVARQLRNNLLNSVYPTDGSSLADVGIQTDRYGKLTFDEAKFTEAYAADPAAVTAKFATGSGGAADGFAARVQAVSKTASNSVDGTLTTTIKGRQTTIDRMQDSIESWDIRLELRRETLTRQFTALETALARMNSQSNWLSGQLSSLGQG